MTDARPLQYLWQDRNSGALHTHRNACSALPTVRHPWSADARSRRPGHYHRHWLQTSPPAGELAVLRIVADEIKRHGCCATYVDAIAARAGVSRSTVQRALRQARALGLVTVQERRRAGEPSLTNIVRAIHNGWLTWLRLGGRGDGSRGCQSWSTADNQISRKVLGGRNREPRTQLSAPWFTQSTAGMTLWLCSWDG